MFDAIIAYSLRHRVMIGLMTLALVAGGIWAFGRLPIDAVPDITNNQIQVLTQAPALSALEIERYVSFPVEIALKSLPRVVELRSLSRPGLSVVTVVFEESVDVYFARQQILERLREVEEEMPSGAERPELSPVSTGLGEVFRYTIRDTTGRLSAMDLRTVQDWIVRRGLLGTAGIAEVNSLGGSVRQYHVLVNPDALISYDLTLRDVFDAVARTSGNAGGGYIETGAEQLSVRSVGLATSLADLRSTVIRAAAGTPVTLGNVATVEIGAALRFGSASQDGRGEVVTGITMQLQGANARTTIDAVKARIEEIAPSLPHGVVIEPYYDREVLVDRTIATVVTNLVEGALLVVGILLLFLVNLRAGVIVASVIPLAMMFAGIMMVLTGQTGNLMSLGAIDFGLVVDGSLIIVDNVLRLLERRFAESNGAAMTDAEMRRLVFGGSVEVRKAAQFGEIIIIVVYLPILTLQGIEGKLFRPMALTVVYALAGALVLSVTYVPMMLSLFLKKSGTIRHSPIITFLQRRYRPMLERALTHRTAIVGSTLVLLALAVFAFTRMGGEFIPRLDEGDISMFLIRLPSVSLSESQKIATRVEREIMRFPEVATVVSHTGRAEISTDPMGFEVADVFIILKSEGEWATGRTKAELVEAMSERMEEIPGIGVQFLQP
ncbi:MAG TPA: CusA/CzcA family heavy metal efflux RND transporter, partial [Candidatus Kapabacteria bacterium]|nr:CusA/CzcA family heavy metal efflux RND transporter [Candidatus Kapabacteria bacterium]